MRRAKDISANDFLRELVFTASRSSGPGGQNVNKVSSRIELRFNITNSLLLTEDQKQILYHKLKSRITGDGDLIVVSQESRSQVKNKELAIEKFIKLIEKALKPEKKRKATRPTLRSKEHRLEAKKITSVIKKGRKPPKMDNS
jgi:ribosome-associated protein